MLPHLVDRRTTMHSFADPPQDKYYRERDATLPPSLCGLSPLGLCVHV